MIVSIKCLKNDSNKVLIKINKIGNLHWVNHTSEVVIVPIATVM